MLLRQISKNVAENDIVVDPVAQPQNRLTGLTLAHVAIIHGLHQGLATQGAGTVGTIALES